MQTAYDLVKLAAARAPGHLALVDDRSDRRLTYAQLLTTIDRIAAGFAAHGIGTGQRVATCLPNLYEHGLALLALTRLGAVPALINARLKPEDVGRLIEQGKMAAALMPADLRLAAAVRPALPKGAPLFTVGGAVDGAVEFASCDGDPEG